MTHEEFQEAAMYWEKKVDKSTQMGEEELMAEISRYLEENNTCALATGAGEFVRCTPLEYSWSDGKIWIFSEGGMKFAALEKNRNVCVAVFDKYQGFGKLKGMQITGTAEIVEPFSKTYSDCCARKNIPVEALKKMAHPMNLLCITPSEIVFLNSSFKEKGYDSRQTWKAAR